VPFEFPRGVEFPLAFTMGLHNFIVGLSGLFGSTPCEGVISITVRDRSGYLLQDPLWTGGYCWFLLHNKLPAIRVRPKMSTAPAASSTTQLPDTLNQRWANDEDSVGQKMMRKLGWKKGQGLGAEASQGAVQAIKVKGNRTQVGLGFSQTKADPMQAQTAEFSNVLASLQEEFATETADPASAASPGQPTVELKAPKRQRRGYKKFSDAKDVSKFSKDDLKAILGIPKD